MKFVKNETFGCESVTSGALHKIAKMQNLSNPIKVPVRLTGLSGSGDKGMCHTNCLLMADLYGGKVLSGFSLDGGVGDHSWISGHSVWITPEGSAVCITTHGYAKKYNITTLNFIPLWVHESDDIKSFFEDNKPINVPQNYIMKNRDWVMTVVPEEGEAFVDFMTYQSRGNKKQFLKGLMKEGVFGNTKDSLIRALQSNEKHIGFCKFDWFVRESKKNNLKFLNDKSPRLAEVA